MVGNLLSRARPMVAAMILACAATAAAAAEESVEALIALLVDLPGWQAEEGDGADMRANGARWVAANRTYAKGDRTIDVGVYVGAGGGPATPVSGMRIEMRGQRFATEFIAGFQVSTFHNRDEGAGAIFVQLVPGDRAAFMAFGFEGLAPDEALALARRFDWAAIAKRASGFL